MIDLKFRTPVVCQNGHKALWYWQIKDSGIGEVKHEGVVSNRCDCPKGALGEGYARAGEDQQFTGILDVKGKPIYVGDILDKDKFIPWVVVWGKSGFYVHNLYDPAHLYPFDCAEGRTIIGNVTENPDIIK